MGRSKIGFDFSTKKRKAKSHYLHEQFKTSQLKLPSRLRSSQTTRPLVMLLLNHVEILHFSKFWTKFHIKNYHFLVEIQVFEDYFWAHFSEFHMKNYLFSVKDTVTVFKFLWISDFFSNRRFLRDKAQNINSFSLTNNCWVWVLFFWGQILWVIPMTSSIKASMKPTKYTKNPGSLKRMKKFDFEL